MTDILPTIFSGVLWISIDISLKFVPKDPVNIIPALVQIMAWRWTGAQPLSAALMDKVVTHICATRPQWVKAQGAHESLTRNFPELHICMIFFVKVCICSWGLLYHFERKYVVHIWVYLLQSRLCEVLLHGMRRRHLEEWYLLFVKTP